MEETQDAVTKESQAKRGVMEHVDRYGMFEHWSHTAAGVYAFLLIEHKIVIYQSYNQVLDGRQKAFNREPVETQDVEGKRTRIKAIACGRLHTVRALHTRM